MTHGGGSAGARRERACSPATPKYAVSVPGRTSENRGSARAASTRFGHVGAKNVG